MATETKPPTVPQPVTEQQPATESQPAAEQQPSTESKPAAETQSATESKPDAEAQPAPESKPTTETQGISETQPATESQPATEAQPATEKQSAKNLSFILHEVKKVGFEDRPVPEITDPYQVLVEVKFTGICGSDVHYWQHGSIGPYVVKGAFVLGHESAGIISQVGSSVKSLKQGDRVAMEPGVPCRRCVRCKEGNYNLCSDMKFAATPPIDGTLAKYYLLPEDYCYKLPDELSLEEGALMEPLAVAVHVTKQGSIKQGDNVVVFGSGPVGLLCCSVAKALGAKKVIAVDIAKSRLEFAKKFAATAVFEPERVAAAENAERMKKENDMPIGADVVIDASGVEPSIQTGIHVLRTGGTYVQGGMGRDECTFPIMAACTKELTVKGSFRYSAGDYQTAIELARSGKVKAKEIITSTVDFDKAEEAFNDVKDGKGLKALIRGPTA